MGIKKLYIQQSFYDGSTYQKGAVVDTFATYHVAIRDIPYKYLPEIKDLPKRDWNGTDGEDIYIPKHIPMKGYELEVNMLYKGSEDYIKDDIRSFVDYLYGRNAEATGGRLFIYDEYTQTGRKDVYVKSISSSDYYVEENDTDAICAFSVKFYISDPVTSVSPTYTEGRITDLSY